MKTYLRICDGFQGILLKGTINSVEYTFQYTLDGAFKHAGFNHTMGGRTAILSVERSHFVYHPYWAEGEPFAVPQECWGDPDAAINHFMPNIRGMWAELLAAANAEIKCKLDEALELWALTSAMDLMKEV